MAINSRQREKREGTNGRVNRRRKKIVKQATARQMREIDEIVKSLKDPSLSLREETRGQIARSLPLPAGGEMEARICRVPTPQQNRVRFHQDL